MLARLEISLEVVQLNSFLTRLQTLRLLSVFKRFTMIKSLTSSVELL
jgi:hypothetical protein